MITLILSVALVLGLIALSALNPQTIDLNFFGILFKGMPISIFMLIFILIGVCLGLIALGSSFIKLKSRFIEERKQVEILSKKEIALKEKVQELQKSVDMNSKED